MKIDFARIGRKKKEYKAYFVKREPLRFYNQYINQPTTSYSYTHEEDSDSTTSWNYQYWQALAPNQTVVRWTTGS